MGIPYVLLLQKYLEAFAEAFGRDAGFQLKSGTEAGCFVHIGVVEIFEVIPLSYSEKKRGLREEAQGFEPLTRAPLAESCEVDMRG